MNRQLPSRPNLDQLKHQAKNLFRDLRDGSSEASARFRECHPRLENPRQARLNDAQLVLAREYGFASWPRLKQYVAGLESVENRVAELQRQFSIAAPEGRRQLLRPLHNWSRMGNRDPNAESLSEHDARLLVANAEGYAFWTKYESYLHLDPAVQFVIRAVRSGNLRQLQAALHADPSSANPKWGSEFPAPNPIPNDSIPLFCVSEGIFRGTNQKGNDYDLARALLASGAEIGIAGDLVMTGAVSFNAIGVARALLEYGAPVDGVDGDGVPMAYPLHFGFRDLAELLARHGAKLDLRFAAGAGRLDLVKDWFLPDGSLKPGAGALSDPYGFESKSQGGSPLRCERTRENILSQALYFACIHGRFEVSEFLLSQGADINALVPGLEFRATVLHRVAGLNFAGATESGEMDPELRAVRFLLDHGANPDIRDPAHHGKPIDWAHHFKRQDVVDLLNQFAEGRS